MCNITNFSSLVASGDNKLCGVEHLVGSETQHARPQTSGKVSDSTSNLLEKVANRRDVQLI